LQPGPQFNIYLLIGPQARQPFNMSKRTLILAALAIVLFIAALVSLLIEKNEEINNLQPEEDFKTPETIVDAVNEFKQDSRFKQDVKITPDDTREAENG